MVVHAIHNTAITVATIFAMSGIMLWKEAKKIKIKLMTT
jgi:hypothetical protein